MQCSQWSNKTSVSAFDVLLVVFYFHIRPSPMNMLSPAGRNDFMRVVYHNPNLSASRFVPNQNAPGAHLYFSSKHIEDWKQLGQLIKTTFVFSAGNRPPILKPGAVAPGYPRLFQTSCFHHQKVRRRITQMRPRECVCG
jgi:hypothetical protein